MTVTIPKPLKIITLTETSHIGLHIRKRRLELKLGLEAAAAKLHICVAALCNWESGKVIPRGINASNIIMFLGYDPYSFKTETLGQRIRAYRLLHGYTLKQFGNLIGVGEGTVVDWEIDTFVPLSENLEKLNKLLK